MGVVFTFVGVLMFLAGIVGAVLLATEWGMMAALGAALLALVVGITLIGLGEMLNLLQMLVDRLGDSREAWQEREPGQKER